MTKHEKKIYDIQSPQTKRMMDIQAGRKVPEVVLPPPQVLKEDGSVDLNVREISQEEYDSYQMLRYRRGELFEEVRTAYLTKAAKEGKIHISLMNQIETDHVMPTEIAKDSAERAYMGVLATIKDRFKKMMDSMFKPTHAEIIAEGMRKVKP